MSDELLGKYIAGEATAEEAEIVRRWLAESPDHPAELARFEQLWRAAGTRSNGISQAPVDTDAAWQRVRRQMQRTGQADVPEPFIRPPMRTERSPWRVWAPVAATVLLVSALSILTYRSFQTPESIVPTSTTFLTQTTTTTTRQLTLPDGSTVTLNRRSTLRYPDAFEGKSREVTLTGEAFFDVKSDKNKPFIIHAQDTDVRVVGTSFGVRAYDRNIRVSVKTGRVLVRKNRQEVALTPGQQATVDANADTLRRLPRFDANALAYGTKQLEFTNQPLSSVVATLSDYYQTDIDLSASRLQNCRLTAHFTNEPVESVLGIVAETLQLTVQRTQTGFVLTGEGCQ